MELTGLFYVRFMDDVLVLVLVLVLAPSRWKLRRAVKTVNEMLGSLELEKHPDKTFIGRIERGFDFLGYQFSPLGPRVAKATIQKFVHHAARLYEQKREEPEAPSMLGLYVRLWLPASFWPVGSYVGISPSFGYRDFDLRYRAGR